jgi:acyl-CoA hydrolase
MPSATVPADLEVRLARVASILESRNIDAIVVDDATAARDVVLGLLPESGEVHWGKSKTLDDLGITTHLLASETHEPLRPKYMALDRATHGREIRKMTASPDVMLGSVAAITEDGALVAASATGSQLAAYASGAGRLILVVGSQKLVPDIPTALARIQDVAFPWENEQVRSRLGVDTRLEKVLILFGEWSRGRTTVVLVKEPVGI